MLGSLDLGGVNSNTKIHPASPSANLTTGIPITICCGSMSKTSNWNGTSFEDLVRMYNREFHGISARIGIPNNPRMAPAGELMKWRKLQERAFYLRDKEHDVFYESFRIEDISPNSVVFVHEPLLRQIAEQEKKLWTQKASESAKAILSECDSVSTNAENQAPKNAGAEAPSDSTHVVKAWDETSGSPVTEQGPRQPQTIREQIWIMMDDPSSSPVAKLITCASLLLIVFSTATFCIESLPQFYTPKTDQTSWWYIAEGICISFFTLEAIVRLCTCPNVKEYLGELLNIIDIIAILPFYIELMLRSIEVPGLAVFRVVRLVRVFRMMKVSRSSIMIFAVTMKDSQRPLYMLVALTSIAMIVMSSLIYYVERGHFNQTLGVWEKLSHYNCEVNIERDFVIPDDYPIRESLTTQCTRVWPQPESLTEYQARYICPYNYLKSKKSCSKVYIQTAFESIPRTFSFVLQTMTTVGYGDDSPTTKAGKVLGSVIMVFGMLVIALPITVIGSNFSRVYHAEIKALGRESPDSGDLAQHSLIQSTGRVDESFEAQNNNQPSATRQLQVRAAPQNRVAPRSP